MKQIIFFFLNVFFSMMPIQFNLIQLPVALCIGILSGVRCIGINERDHCEGGEPVPPK